MTPVLHPIICPFCFHRFAADEAKFRCHRTACVQEPDADFAEKQGLSTPPLLGHVITPPPRNIFNRLKIQTAIACDKCKQETRSRICPNCHFELSADAGLIDQKIIAIIGGRATGKTHYIATLGTQLQRVIGRNFHFAFMPIGDNTQRRWRDEFYVPLYERHQLLGATASAEVNAAIKAPLIFRLTVDNNGHRRALNLSFFDTAGEDMGSLDRMSSQARYITDADGIIFLLDPLQAGEVRRRLPSSILPPADTKAQPEAVVSALRQLFESAKGLKGTTKIKTPVAFTLSKSDTLLTLPEVDPGSKLRSNGTHHGSVNQAEMQSVSTEVENYVQEWLGSNFSVFVQHGFEDYAYFTVSALGATPQGSQLAHDVDPLRVEDPLLWLLAKFDLVPVTKGR